MKNYYNMDSLDIYRYSLSDGIYDYGKDDMRNDYDEKIIPDVDNFLEAVNDSFFLYVNLQATHYPYEYPENNSVFLPDKPDSIFTSYISIAEGDYNKTINRYDNSLLYVDKQVGALMDLLEEYGFSNNTIIILSADHGEVFNDTHGTIRHGSGVYDEEVKVPLIIYVPGVGHKVIDERVRHLDVVPSVLSISNFTPSPEFQGETMKKDTDIFLMAQNQNFKIGLIRDDIKYIIDRATLGSEAYNLTEDPDELNNLIVDVDDAKFYRENYGSVLWPWYYCQMDYYENERWLQGEIINCA